MVDFFPTRDLDFFAGEEMGMTTSTLSFFSLKKKRHYQTLKSSEVSEVHKSHFVVNLIVPIVRQQIRSITHSPTHQFSFEVPKLFQARLPKLFSLPLENRSSACSSKIWRPKNTLESQIDCFIIFPGSPRHSTNHCRGWLAQRTTTPSTELRTGFSMS